jgi:hypothetical protein
MKMSRADRNPWLEKNFFRSLISNLNKITYLYVVSSTYANILKYHIQGMPTNILLHNLKRSRRTVIFLPKTVQLKTLDFLQQTITMNENAQ